MPNYHLLGGFSRRGSGFGDKAISAEVAAGNFTTVQTLTDARAELGALHDFVMSTAGAAQAYWTGKAILSSLDWQYAGGVGLQCIAANNTTDSFRVSVPGDFDYWGRFVIGAAPQTGFVAVGAAQTASFTWDNTPRLVIAFTGQANINIAFAGSTIWLRLVRDSAKIRYYYRVNGNDPWILGAEYSHTLGESVIVSLRSGIGATVAEFTASEGIPEIRGANVGGGAGLVLRDVVSDILNLRSIKAGAGVGVLNNADDITLSASLSSITNVGTGGGLVYRDTVGGVVNLKTIKAGFGQTVTNNADDITILPTPGVVTLTDAATITVDASLGNKFKVTLGGARTLGTPTNPQADGQLILFRIIQDGSGGRTLAYDAGYRFSTDIPSPTLSLAIGAVDYLGFVYNLAATKWDCIGKVFGF